jgi:hypothetical protein
MKKTTEIGREIKPLKIKEEEQWSLKPIKVTPLPNSEDMFPQPWDVWGTLILKIRRVILETHIDMISNDLLQNIFRHHLHPNIRRCNQMRVRKRSPNSRIFLMLLLILFGEGLDAYWMMSKDLENKVDDINMMENPPRICYWDGSRK